MTSLKIGAHEETRSRDIENQGLKLRAIKFKNGVHVLASSQVLSLKRRAPGLLF